MQGRDFKDGVFSRFAQMASAFASPKRVEIIDVLAQGERNVETLALRTGLSVANTSKHLQVLKQANLVASRKEGLQVFYRLADPSVLQAYWALQSLAQDRLTEVNALARDFFSSADGLEPLTLSELASRIEEGDVVLIDVRPSEEYAAGHIAGAVSAPVSELRQGVKNLPANKTVVAYCRGPYCVMSADAVRLLRDQGFDAVRLGSGFPEWKDADMPVEVGVS